MRKLGVALMVVLAFLLLGAGFAPALAQEHEVAEDAEHAAAPQDHEVSEVASAHPSSHTPGKPVSGGIALLLLSMVVFLGAGGLAIWRLR